MATILKLIIYHEQLKVTTLINLINKQLIKEKLQQAKSDIFIPNNKFKVCRELITCKQVKLPLKETGAALNKKKKNFIF